MAGSGKWAGVRRNFRAPGGATKLRRAPQVKSAGASDEASEAVRFEGYGPGGTALLMACLTDSSERAAAQLRQVLRGHGGHLGARDSVSYLFNEVGLLVYPRGTSSGQLRQAAWAAGAEDVVADADGSIEVLTDPLEFEAIRTLLEGRGFFAVIAEVTQRAAVPVPLTGETAQAMVSLLRTLEQRNDIQVVYTNAEIPDELLANI